MANMMPQEKHLKTRPLETANYLFYHSDSDTRGTNRQAVSRPAHSTCWQCRDRMVPLCFYPLTFTNSKKQKTNLNILFEIFLSILDSTVPSHVVFISRPFLSFCVNGRVNGRNQFMPWGARVRRSIFTFFIQKEQCSVGVCV